MNKKKWMIIVDICMMIALLLSMENRLTGTTLHTIVGYLGVGFYLIHNVIHRGWYRSLAKGKYTFHRILQIIINIGLLISIITLAVTGIMLANTVFEPFILQAGLLIQGVHKTASQVMFILVFMHLGNHLQMMVSAISKKKRASRGQTITAAVLVGILAVVLLQLNNHMQDTILINCLMAQMEEQTEETVDETEPEENVSETTESEPEQESEASDIDADLESSEDMQEESEDVTENTTEETVQEPEVRKNVEISFDYNRAGTPASNQIAIWMEDVNGTLIKTIYVSRFTSTGGYTYREDSLPLWVSKANPAGMSGSEIDAVTSATPSSGRLSYIWDGTDQYGNEVAVGTYSIHMEATLYWSSIVRYEGIVEIGTEPNDNTIAFTETYTESTDTNRNMIQDVFMQYVD